MIIWSKVPSHVTVEGNNEADRLASVGLPSCPPYPAPHKEAMLLCSPLPCHHASILKLNYTHLQHRKRLSELIFL